MSDPVSSSAGGDPQTAEGPGTRLLEFVCAGLIAIMVILLFIQVFGRYAMSDPPDWTEELARTAFVYATFVGGALAVARNAHLRIETVINMLPVNARIWFHIFATVGGIIFLGYVLYYSYGMLHRLAGQNLVTVPVSKALVFAGVPIGCALMLIYEFKRLWIDIRRLLAANAPGQG